MPGLLNVQGENYRWKTEPDNSEVLFKAQSSEQPPRKMLVHISSHLQSKFDASKTLKEQNQHAITPVIASDLITQAIKQGWRSRETPMEFDANDKGVITKRPNHH